MAVLCVVIVVALRVRMHHRGMDMVVPTKKFRLDEGSRVLPVPHIRQHWQHRDRENPGGALRTHFLKHTAFAAARDVHRAAILLSRTGFSRQRTLNDW